MKRNLALSVACALGAALLLSGCGNADYNQGVQYMQAGQYQQAIESFAQCPSYEDAVSLADECAYRLGQQYWASGNGDAARVCLKAVTGEEYSDAAQDLLSEISNEEAYEAAQAALQAGDYQTAYEILITLGDYKDAPELLSRFHFEQHLIGEAYTTTDRLHGTVTENIEYLYDTNGVLSQIHADGGYQLPSFPAEVLSWAYVPLVRSYATDEFFTWGKDGRLAAITGKDAGSVVFQIDYIYDDQGRVLQENLSRCAQISRPEDVTHYNYDADGNLSFLTFDNDNYKRVEFTYNEDGTLSRLTTTHLMFPVVIDYTYENGRLVRADITRAKTGMGMQPYRSDVYAYHEDSTLSSVTSTYAEGVSSVTSAVTEYIYGTVLCYSETR